MKTLFCVANCNDEKILYAVSPLMKMTAVFLYY